MEKDSIGSMRELLRRFLRQASSEMQHLADGSPLTVPQCIVLLEIGRRRESTVGDLAAHLGLDKSTLSRTVDVLIAKELARREPFPNDRRYNRVTLSEEGCRIHSSLDAAQDLRIEAVLAEVSPERRAELLRSFEFLVEAFEAKSEEPDRPRSHAATQG